MEEDNVRPISDNSKIGITGVENRVKLVLLTMYYGVVPEEGRPLFLCAKIFTYVAQHLWRMNIEFSVTSEAHSWSFYLFYATRCSLFLPTFL